MEKLTSENLSEFINTYPTKHKYGFLATETNDILEKFGIDKDNFYTALGVNTCMIIEGQTLNYHDDIELALRCVIENREKTLDEWD
jgi:hypothetical protein